MKAVLKHVLTSVIFLSGLLVILFATSYLYSPKNNEKSFGIVDLSANGILGENDNSVDVLFLGDSEAFSTFSPMRIWQNHGITSYVCATGSQRLCLTESYLHQAFENQKPKVVILETNAIFRKMTIAAPITNKVENLFYVFRYHNRWKSVLINEIGRTIEYTWTDDNKGYRFSIITSSASTKNYMQPSEDVKEIPSLNKKYFDSIQKFCKENGAELVLVSVPSTVNWNFSKHNSIEKLAKEYNLTYVDMNLLKKDIPINWKHDTRDKGDHLNYSGAIKATDYMGQYLSDNFVLTDHRQDKDYNSWNESLQRYLITTSKTEKKASKQPTHSR